MDELQAYFAQVKICTAVELGEGLYHDDSYSWEITFRLTADCISESLQQRQIFAYEGWELIKELISPH